MRKVSRAAASCYGAAARAGSSGKTRIAAAPSTAPAKASPKGVRLIRRRACPTRSYRGSSVSRGSGASPTSLTRPSERSQEPGRSPLEADNRWSAPPHRARRRGAPGSRRSPRAAPRRRARGHRQKSCGVAPPASFVAPRSGPSQKAAIRDARTDLRSRSVSFGIGRDRDRRAPSHRVTPPPTHLPCADPSKSRSRCASMALPRRPARPMLPAATGRSAWRDTRPVPVRQDPEVAAQGAATPDPLGEPRLTFG
jgi:hypothetical protein